MKILLLEDDLHLCSSIQDELQKAGYVIDYCNDGETGMLYALNIEYCYDLAIIDRTTGSAGTLNCVGKTVCMRSNWNFAANRRKNVRVSTLKSADCGMI